MLVLASASPRRREILSLAGIPFTVRSCPVDESILSGEVPQQMVRRLACAKALAVACGPDEIVLGADTDVVVGAEILGKPKDAADAARMLRLLSGREHEVITGICLRRAGSLTLDADTTRVRFIDLSDQEIDRYVASGEPMDKAGAYAIQGLASKFIDQIDGCFWNVVGLPVSLLYKHLRRMDPACSAGGPASPSMSRPPA